MRAGKRVAAREARRQPQPLGARDDGALHRPDVRDDRARRDVVLETLQQLHVRGGRRREDEQLRRARHVGGAGRRVVDCPLLHRGGALRGVGAPAEHRRDAGALRLEGDGPADRAEAENAQGVGTHGDGS